MPKSVGKRYAVQELEDSEIPGIAQRYQELQDRGLKEEEILAVLSSEKRSLVRPDTQTRGPIGDWFKNALAALRGRKLLKDLGEITVPVTWLVFDIPHKSRASLEWTVGREKDAGFSLELFGTGFGAGRVLSWSATQAIAERDSPVVFTRDIIANVKLYETSRFGGGSKVEAETSVVGRGPTRLVSEKRSAVKLATQIDASKFEIEYDKAVDLEKYDVTLSETDSYSIDKELNLSIGFEALKLPEGISAQISGRLKSHCSCTVNWVFAPGFIHQPYWDKQNRGLLPFWSIRKRS